MFAEDMSVFFSDAEFATPVSFNGGEPVNCIFDNAYLDAQGTAATTPVLTAPTASLGGVAYGSAALVGGVAYSVVSIEPDGTGISSVQLRK